MKLTRTNKVLLTLGSVGVAATIAGAGTWATFTDTDSVTQAVSAGTVAVSFNGAGEGVAVLPAIGNVAPGDTIGRTITLTNTGSLALASVELDSVTLSDEGASGNDLFDDASGPLQLAFYDCDIAWVAPVTTAAEWTCDGDDVSTLTPVLDPATAVGHTGELAGVTPAADGGSDNLLALFTVPAGLDNDAQGDSGTLTLAFTATQRDAQNS